MDIETYKAQIRAIDEQIDSTKKQIHKIEGQIEDAQNARISANTMRNEFEDFVAKRKNSVGRPVKGKHLKAFRSFFNKAQSILTGAEFWKTSALIDEVSGFVNDKIKHYEENLDYCKNELRRLNKQKELLVEEYNLAILAASSEGGLG